MPCMCGDLCCPSCGPAQGNSQCQLCGTWASEIEVSRLREWWLRLRGREACGCSTEAIIAAIEAEAQEQLWIEQQMEEIERINNTGECNRE